MIILPDRNTSNTKILMPVPKSQWRAPSLSQPKDGLGNENHTCFRLDARLNDGHLAWRGWFDDRDDADAFLHSLMSGSLLWERALWDLPSPAWYPGLAENLSYYFATVTFLTTPTGSNQTYTVPTDFNILNNSIQVIGAGGSGAANIQTSTRYSTGGGGGGYSITNNVNISGTATYQIGKGGAAVARASGSIGITAGNLGGDTWFGATTLASSLCGAKGGSGGVGATSGTQSGGAGGVSTSGVGNTRYSGGRGGNSTATGIVVTSTGGGGAGGPNGNGNNGGDTASGNTAGGSGGAGSGGAGGAAFSSAGTGANGGSGTDISTSPAYGSGGGSGGAYPTDGSAACTAGSGGSYGAGGGAVVTLNTNTGSQTSGAGAGGLIVVTYTPFGSAIIPGFLTFAYS